MIGISEISKFARKTPNTLLAFMREENCPITRIGAELISEEGLYSAWVTQRIREKIDYETDWSVVLKSLVDDNAERK